VSERDPRSQTAGSGTRESETLTRVMGTPGERRPAVATHCCCYELGQPLPLLAPGKDLQPSFTLQRVITWPTSRFGPWRGDDVQKEQNSPLFSPDSQQRASVGTLTPPVPPNNAQLFSPHAAKTADR